MTETELHNAVIDLCKLYRISWYHTHNSRRSVPGWPDLALCGNRGFITRELKSDTGRISRAQGMWGRRLLAAGVGWSVWRPDDLRSGRITRELSAIRLRRPAWTPTTTPRTRAADAHASTA